LATALGVKFLDKLAAVVDYRSTRRVLELIWIAVGVAIHIYMRKKDIKIEEILSGLEYVVEIMNCKNLD